jgi:hypothetical protein
VKAPTREHVDAYRRDGFVLVEGFLDADELGRWRAVTANAVAERQAVAAPIGDEYYQRTFAQLQRLADTNARMAELILDARLAEIAATLAGVDGLRVWHDQALIKLHNGLTAHAAGANVTPRPRRAMTCAYMPDGSTFNGVQNVLPDDYFAALALGDVLDDDSVNPLVWSRS